MRILFLLLALWNIHLVKATTDKYRLVIQDNPATKIVIGWNQVSGTNPIVYYGITNYGNDFQRYENQKSADRKVQFRGMNNHFARLDGLTPNTAYYFVIRDSDGQSEQYWFKTAPDDKSPISLIAGGDSRNNRDSRQKANKLVSKLKPTAVFFGGDMTNSDTDKQWAQWLDDWQLTIAANKRIFPLVPARGNHESENLTIYNLFDTPSEFVYYAITFGDNLLRAYTLNTEIAINGEQTEWLKNDLKAWQQTDWKIAQYHKPMRPHVSSKREGLMQYIHWAKLFHENNMNLVIECHSHTVKSTWPVRPSNHEESEEGFIRDDENGTIYVGEGSWGAPLRKNDDNKSWTRDSGMFNQFKWIFISKEKIECRTVKTDNAFEVEALHDEEPFTMPKNIDIWNPDNGPVVEILN